MLKNISNLELGFGEYVLYLLYLQFFHLYQTRHDFLKFLFTYVLSIKYKGKTILYGELLRQDTSFYLSDKIEISY